jgi:hypothetical protein|tara:strand:- start:277 stop:1107 length:831 start_codon:yes stop_codon:yes gene_type:complete
VKKYKLVNENRGDEIIAMLEEILDGDVFDKLNKGPKLLTKIILKTKNGKEFELYKEGVALIKELHHKQPNLTLNHYLADNYLSFDESVLCILGLNPIVVRALNNNPRVINKKIKGVMLKNFIMEIPEGRSLSKAPRIGKEFGFISDAEDKIYTDGLITWAIKKKYIEETTNDELIDSKKDKDPETGILLYRLKIYKATLPDYLNSLDLPTSIRQLSLNSNEQTDGEYSIQIKSVLGVGSASVKKNLEALVKTLWWKNQPELIRDKLPTNKQTHLKN